jgi:uncharacterized membrane-anchored protein
MGLRAATSVLLIMGAVTVAGADTRHATPEPATAKADPKPAEAPDPAAADQVGKAAEGEALPPHLVGPRHVELGNHTSIELPDGMILLEREVVQEMLRKQGDRPDGVVALVFKPESSWRVYIEYADSGYVDDSDAGELDADDLLESYRQGTIEQNKTRKALGQSELVIDSWTERPRYERAQHQLVWGLAGHSIEGKVVNFFTRVLGRNGYLSLDLIDEPERLEASKKEALVVLEATRFTPGSTYADHSSSDKSSGIGLRGLVLGGAGVAVASKLGLIAKILLVFKKGFIVVFAAIGGLFRWLFRRKPRDQAADPLAGLAVADPTGSPVPPEPPLPPPAGDGTA